MHENREGGADLTRDVEAPRLFERVDFRIHSEPARGTEQPLLEVELGLDPIPDTLPEVLLALLPPHRRDVPADHVSGAGPSAKERFQGGADGGGGVEAPFSGDSGASEMVVGRSLARSGLTACR